MKGPVDYYVTAVKVFATCVRFYSQNLSVLLLQGAEVF